MREQICYDVMYNRIANQITPAHVKSSQSEQSTHGKLQRVYKVRLLLFVIVCLVSIKMRISVLLISLCLLAVRVTPAEEEEEKEELGTVIGIDLGTTYSW